MSNARRNTPVTAPQFGDLRTTLGRERRCRQTPFNQDFVASLVLSEKWPSARRISASSKRTSLAVVALVAFQNQNGVIGAGANKKWVPAAVPALTVTVTV